MSIFSTLSSFRGLRLYLAVFVVAVAALVVIGAMGSHGQATTAHAQPVCGLMWQEVTVCIELTPETDSNLVGTSHTVTATVTEDGAVPSTPWLVAFTITGANAGTVGSCSPNADCSVDALGQVDFTYTPIDSVLGTDTITGCIVEPANGQGPTGICDDASKDWYVPTPTPTPTPAATPTPTPTATPAATPTATPTPTPEAAPAEELPATGGQPPDGSSGLPWLAAIASVVAVTAASGFWFAYQRRHVR